MKNLEHINRASAAAVWFVGASLIFCVLAAVVTFSVKVPAIDAERAELISKSFAEMQKTENAALANAGWVDQPRGIVRMPLEAALQKAAQAWQNPAQARADLNARADHAAAPAPVVAPKPSVYE